MPHSSGLHTAAIVVVAAIGTVAVLGLGQLRAAIVEAQAAERAEAWQQLTDEVAALSHELGEPLHEIDTTVPRVLDALIAAFAGSTKGGAGSPVELDRHTQNLEAAADQLEAAAARPLPDRPRALPVGEVDPILEHVGRLQQQALTVADLARDAAATSRSSGAAAHRLAAGAADFAASSEELPASTRPDALMTAWRQEQDRIQRYRVAVDRVAGTEGVSPLAAVHRDLVDTLDDLSQRAVEQLERGDLAAYNQLLDEVLSAHDRDIVREELVEAARTSLRRAGASQLEDAQAHALGLLHELTRLDRQLRKQTEMTVSAVEDAVREGPERPS